jgi:NitT/TauT family transport system permease protein
VWSERLHAPTLILFLIVRAIWQLLSRRYGAYIMPPPWSVVTGRVGILRSGELWQHTWASLWRILVGFGGAMVVAILMGLAASLWRQAKVAVRDLLAILNATSVFVWIVVSLIWFGLTDAAPMFTTFMITLPVVASNVMEGVENVDRRLLEMGRAYRLTGWERFRSIVIPSTMPSTIGGDNGVPSPTTMPYLVAGMKVGFGLALKVSVVAEIFGVTSGIGYIMNYSRDILATQMVFVWAVVMVCIMLLTDKIVFERIARAVLRWQ